ncbi:MAG: PDZ domain-containing protein [Planctomycetes bacterium]|nr:PDZ domain-containing protein [Planctomycetota bacterium]
MKLKRIYIVMALIVVLVISDAVAKEPEILAQFDTVSQMGPLLPVTIAGKEHLFMLDTGASFTVFDKSLSRYLGEERGETPLFSHDKVGVFKFYEAPELFAGSIKLDCDIVICLDLTLFSLICGRKIGGVVGMDFLKQHIIQLDFDQKKVFFLKSKSNRVSSWGEGFDVKLHYNRPYVELSILDDLKTEFMIDTGSNSSISLNNDLFKRLMSKGDRNRAESISGTALGVLKTDSMRYENFSVESFEKQNIIIDSNPVHNLIGTGYLSRFLVTFDFPNSKVYFKKGKNFNKVDEMDMSGLHLLLISGNVFVHSVDKDSPAKKAGIKARDIIVKVNSKDANTYGMWKLRGLLTSGDKQKITMTIKRKGEIKEVSFLLRKKI